MKWLYGGAAIMLALVIAFNLGAYLERSKFEDRFWYRVNRLKFDITFPRECGGPVTIKPHDGADWSYNHVK